MTASAEGNHFGFWLVVLLIAGPLLNIVAWHFGTFVNPVLIGMVWLVALAYCARHARVFWPILLVVPVFAIILLGQPVSAWDARSIWFFHGKRIFLDGTASAQLDGYANWSHNDYPILVPAMAASFARMLKHWNEIFPKLAIFATTAPVFLLMALVLRRPLVWALWFTALLLAAGPSLGNGYVDPLTGLFFGAALVMASRLQWPLRTPAGLRMDTWLLALLTASLALTKNEGLPALFTVALTAFFGPRGGRILWACVLGFLLYAVLWKVPVWHAQIGNDLFVESPLQKVRERLADAQATMRILGELLQHAGPYLLAGLVFLISRPRTAAAQQGPVFALAVYWVMLFGVYLMTPHDLAWHLATSASRTMMVVNVAMVTYLAWALSTADPAIRPATPPPPHQPADSPP